MTKQIATNNLNETVVIDPITNEEQELTLNDLDTVVSTDEVVVTEGQHDEEYTRLHSSALIPAGSKMVIQDKILHTRNVTVWSNMLGVNLAEGKKARVITENMVIKAAFNVLQDWRTKADFLAVEDGAGLFQMKNSFVQLADMPDNANIGVVNARYTGKFAGDILGFENSKKAAIASAKNELQATAAMGCWFRLGISGGQVKIEKRLVNLPATPDEGDEVTHMRRQIMRAIAVHELLVSEKSGTPVIFNWSGNYDTGYAASWFIQQMQKPAKVAYEDSLIHQASSQLYKKEVRFRASLADQPEGTVPVKYVVSTDNGKQTKSTTAIANLDPMVYTVDGNKVDLHTAIGKNVRYYMGSWMRPEPDEKLEESNFNDVVARIHRLRFNVMIVDRS